MPHWHISFTEYVGNVSTHIAETFLTYLFMVKDVPLRYNCFCFKRFIMKKNYMKMMVVASAWLMAYTVILAKART